MGRYYLFGGDLSFSRLQLRAMALLGAAWFAVLAVNAAHAVDATWAGPGGEWTTGANWSSAPTVPDNKATFTNNSAPTAVTISSSASINTLQFTAAAPAYSFTVQNAATFTINSGTVNASAFTPSFTVGAGATLRLGEGASVDMRSLSGGGSVAIGSADPTTFLSVGGSTNTTFSGNFSGAGTFELDNAGTTLTLTGTSNGGNIGTIGGDLILCDCFSGGLTISGGSLAVGGSDGVSVFGGTLSLVNGASLQIASDLLVASNMIVSGASVSTSGFTGVGIFGPGPSSLTISNGGSLASQGGAEIDGYLSGPGLGMPNVTVSGPGSTWTIGGLGLFVGAGTTGGPGSLTIANGGVVSVSGGVFVGDPSLGTSAVTVTGPGSVLTAQTSLRIGDTCDCLVGTLTVANGGVVNSPGFTRIGAGSTLNLGNGGLAGAIVTPAIDNRGSIVANFTDTLSLAANISGGGTLSKAGAGTLILSGANSYSGGTTVSGGLINFAAAGNFGSGAIALNGGGLQWAAGNATDISARLAPLGAGGGIVDTNGNTVAFATALAGGGGLTKQGNGTLILSAANSYSGGTTVSGGLIIFAAANNFGTGSITVNGGGLQWATGNTSDISARLAPLGAGGGVFDTNANTVTFATAVSGSGGLTKQGSGTLTLSGANSYGGGTTVNAGTLQLGSGAALAAGGALTVNGGVFALNGNNQTVGALTGTGGAISLGSGKLTAGDTASTLLATAISGSGSLVKQGSGTLTLTGASSFTGGTTLNAGGLVVNGSLASGVTVNVGTLSGNGSIGGLVLNGGVVAPGNSIGTLTVNGSFVQNAGSIYQVEANSAGQSDRINVNGAATINGAAVQVLAQPGTYARNTTYTILNATGGVSGAYSGVSSNFAFLTPSLSYDANNVYLLLFQPASAFAAGALTPNQYAVGSALDRINASATGDLNTVLNTLSVLNIQQGPAALNAISGQQYADFGTLNVQGGALFMNTVAQQMAVARGGAGGGQRQALAQACEIASCDTAGPWGAWASALGVLGTVAGNGNASTLTYNFGGGAAGIDYRFDPRLLVGLGAGYAAGNQWVDSFMGRGWTDSVSVMAYGSFCQAGFYADALAGYAWSGNQMQRQIFIPGLQPRTANGSTGANQFLGQVETGYKLPVFAPAAASVTPFARLQGSTVSQAAFSEWGAQSLSLNVAQQTTNSLRTTFGADLAGAIGLGDDRKLGLALRLGWLHEYADTGRPITAAFAGAPTTSFTVYGATPQRDSAIIGFSAGTAIAQAPQLYLRYDGEIGTMAANHTLNLGVRFTW
jgi:autotransporter-associated beta strand protein/T5SS/PEP-CTERM-associated repeat protein